MAKRALFRQADLSRAILAAHAAGCEYVRVEFDTDGRMIILARRGAPAPSKSNQFDDAL